MHVNWYEGYQQQYGDSADQEIQKLKISCRPKDHAVDMVSNLNKVVLLMNNEEETALAFVAWNYFSLQVQHKPLALLSGNSEGVNILTGRLFSGLGSKDWETGGATEEGAEL